MSWSFLKSEEFLSCMFAFILGLLLVAAIHYYENSNARFAGMHDEHHEFDGKCKCYERFVAKNKKDNF